MNYENFIDSLSINISMVSNLLDKQNGEGLSQIKDKVATIILTHLQELNNYDKDITELKDNIIKNSYNYDDLVLSILDKPDINTSFNLTEIPTWKRQQRRSNIIRAYWHYLNYKAYEKLFFKSRIRSLHNKN